MVVFSNVPDRGHNMCEINMERGCPGPLGGVLWLRNPQNCLVLFS